MRNHLQLAAIIILFITPAPLMAQVPGDGAIQKPSGPGFSTRLNLKGIIQPSKPDTGFPFHFQLPNANKTMVAEHVEMNPHYRNTMPVLKPGNNSKILVAKLDPEFPYKYSMPVLKESDGRN